MEDDNGEYADARRIWVTAAWVLLGTLAGQLASVGVLAAFGYDVLDGLADIAVLPPLVLACMIAAVQLLGYLLPGLVSAYSLFKSAWPDEVTLAPSPSLRQLGIGILAFALCMPLTVALAEVNASIELAGWQADIEESVAATLATIIQGESVATLLVALLIVAVLPAVGEELVFRGLIQPGLIARTNSAHLGVWLTALVFGLIHFQFAGLLPRVFLGAVLGFLAHYSERLWVPIVAHFLFNGLQVVALRFGQIDAEVAERTPLGYESVALLCVGLAGAALAAQLLPRLRPRAEPAA